MKRILSTFLAIAVVLAGVLSLSACGEKSEDKFSGTWKVSFIECEGSKFTVDEWKNAEEEDLSDFCIVFKDGGKAYIFDGDYGDLVDWLKSDEGIMVGDKKCSISDGMICFDYYGDKIYLIKVSDSQEIPKKESGNESQNDNINSQETELTPSQETSSNNSEWKKFLQDYEAWVDKYIELFKKYKADPSNISILTEYTEMLSELSDWSERSEEIELDDADEALEYSEELLRIAKKLAEATY